MAKGKRNVLRINKKPDNSENKVSATDSKENKPATNKDRPSKVQSALHSLLSPRKPRTPLGENPTMLIPEGNESGAASADVTKLKKDPEISSDDGKSKEQKSEPIHGTKDPVTETKQANQSTSTANSTDDGVVPKAKAQKGRKTRTKKTENKTPNRKVTDFFPIRRSNRKTEGELKDQEHKHIDKLILSGTEDGMEIRHIEGKGRGVFAVSGFRKGDFVVEYHGDLLGLGEAKAREARYAQDPSTGCYMYYFQYQSKSYCVDATKESGRLGRLINHSKAGNLQTKLHPIDGTPHLILVAAKDIQEGEELLYDYGDRSKESISAHPWLKS
ncbi:lysine methyltransferase 5Ab [Synchiropus splendidus]|uniref:lysine methyltransferase 5Ab n=1 Tax=Synchiropus splendidus TaxID=270530 RepID=UPI00237D773C|nr:lysine methyltransferase 5Ab [Synchiropus splendidus]